MKQSVFITDEEYGCYRVFWDREMTREVTEHDFEIREAEADSYEKAVKLFEDLNYQVNPEAKTFFVTVGENDRAYGGSEEGGWWYNTWRHLDRRIWAFPSRDKANSFAGRLNRKLDGLVNNGEVGSILYAGGDYSANVFAGVMPHNTPKSRPYYS